MKPKHLFWRVVVGVTVAAGLALAQPPANPGFEKLKSLVGTWEMRGPDGSRSTISYEVVSAGSALLERIGGGKHADMDMVTVYHPDGERLVMTHYCSAKNQPRMTAPPATAPVSELRFSFLDITNLESPDAGHMRGLVVRFDDPDHFTQAWTFRAKGKDTTETFHWSRVK